MAESIKVCIRFRKEMNPDPNLFDEWEFYPEDGQIKLRDKTFSYDYILPHTTEQDEMYEKVGKQTISDFMNGFNGTIFAYGQSGSGKTFSMLGPEDVTDSLALDFNSVPEHVQTLYGITPRAVIQMFETINEFISQGSQCVLVASYIEVYNETIKCLLSKKENLKIREQVGIGMNVADKDSRVCKTPEEIFGCIATANRNRAVTGTQQNSRSSRSHTVLMMDFEYAGVDGVKKSSRLNLVDLAGSERIGKTGVEGQSLKEAQKINQSLTTLGMCIMALTTPGSKHIPFRNSKLTLILKESLGGNSKTTLLCTGSRKKEHCEESVQTLNFASRAKSIKNACKTNVQLGAKELQYIAENLKKEIMIMRGQLKKGGLNFNKLTDPKLISFIPNDAIQLEGDVPESNVEQSEDHLETELPGAGRKRRVSLVNLNEEQIIIKYCELRAKYDNLLEQAGKKINELSNQPKSEHPDSSAIFNDIREVTDEKLKEIVESKNKEINEITEKLEAEKNASSLKENELNSKVQSFLKGKLEAEEERDNAKAELDSMQEMMNLNQSDISTFQQKVEKKKIKITKLKEEIKSVKTDLENNNTKLTDLDSKLLTLEELNVENKKGLETVQSKNSDLLLELETIRSDLKQKEESEAFQSNKNKELQAELAKHLETISSKEKSLSESNNKFTELELKFKAEIENYTNKEAYNLSQIEALKNENQNLNKMMLEKISDQELLAEKEKILNDTKATLEKKIDELIQENVKSKNDLVETTSKFNNQNGELTLQIDNINRELKTKNDEIQTKIFEIENTKNLFEEKLKIEGQKNEQLQSRLDSQAEKIKGLETQIATASEQEKKLNLTNSNLEKELKEKASEITRLNETSASQLKSIEKYGTEVKELKESITETKTKYSEEFELEKKKLNNEQSLLKHELEVKNKKVEDEEKKIQELKHEIKVLQSGYQKLQTRISELELDNARTKRESVVLKKESNVISSKINLKATNIFAHLLKKTGDNKFLQQAKEESKESSKKVEELMKDKIDEFKLLRQNIISLTPKTISSRSSISEVPDLDWTDEDAYRKHEEKMLEKERQHNELKEKLQNIENAQNNNVMVEP